MASASATDIDTSFGTPSVIPSTRAEMVSTFDDGELALKRVSLIEVEKRRELAQLQSRHVEALKYEISRLREENTILADALSEDSHVAESHKAEFDEEKSELLEKMRDLQREATAARADAARESKLRLKAETDLVELTRRVSIQTIEHGAEDLLRRYSATNPKKDVENDTWENLLLETKDFQTRCRDEDVHRMDRISKFRERVRISGKDDSYTKEYLHMLDLLEPRSSDFEDKDGLARLLQIERELDSVKSNRRQLEEQLAHLNQVQANDDGDLKLRHATDIVTERLFELEYENKNLVHSNVELSRQCKLHQERAQELAELIQHRSPQSRTSSYTDLTSHNSNSTYSVNDPRYHG